MSVEADTNTKYDLDYLVTGMDPEAVEFEVLQGNTEKQVVLNQRSQSITVISETNDDIQFCWKKTDRKTKKLDFSFTRTNKMAAEAADKNTLDSLSEDLKIIETEVETLSRNIMKQKNLETEHFQLAASAASTQTWMSILKMVMVIGICVVQIYLITSYF